MWYKKSKKDGEGHELAVKLSVCTEPDDDITILHGEQLGGSIIHQKSSQMQKQILVIPPETGAWVPMMQQCHHWAITSQIHAISGIKLKF